MPQTQSVVWPDDLYNRIKQREKADGVKFSDVVRNAVELYLGLDPEMVKIAIKYGAALDCDPITVIQNLAIGKIAEWDAQKEFFGPTDRLLDEFVRLDGKTVATGDDLYQHLKQTYKLEFEQRVQNQKRLARKHKDLSGLDKDEEQRLSIDEADK